MLGFSGILIRDTSHIADAAQREQLLKAVHALQEAPADLSALETLVRFVQAGVIGSGGSGIAYSYTDPAKAAGYAALSAWYPADFLVRVVAGGSDGAADWALRKIKHQEANSYSGWENGHRKLAGTPQLLARRGLITPAVKRALVPALTKRLHSENKPLRACAENLVRDFGLLLDPKAFVKSLKGMEEEEAAKALSDMMRTTRVDPLITEDIWQILGKARTDFLAFTCIRYPWLFDIERFDAAKQRVLVRLLEDFHDGIGTNLNTALILLARSRNPLAKDILSYLAANSNETAKARAEGYVRVYEEAHQSPAAGAPRR
jgi:hypothetical protein